MEDVTEILERTFNRMPKVFSANDFCNRLRSRGYPNHFITGQNHLAFIRDKTRALTKRTFEKIEIQQKELSLGAFSTSNQGEVKNKEQQIKEAIELLKLEGYKIFKTVTINEEV
jgi:hypothetical protein